jgi:hypothetical protein
MLAFVVATLLVPLPPLRQGLSRAMLTESPAPVLTGP